MNLEELSEYLLDKVLEKDRKDNRKRNKFKLTEKGKEAIAKNRKVVGRILKNNLKSW